MKLQFWAIGKNHEKYVNAGVNEFTDRISRYYPIKWNIIPPPRNASTASVEILRKKESELVLGLLQKDDYLVCMDERGKQLTSEGLSTLIQARANESQKQIIFLIGGAFGLDEAVLKRANYTWSLSQLTFPHQLVRLILCEQVYRACTILRNEKYHHS